MTIERAKYSYNPEKQAGAIRSSQQRGELLPEVVEFKGYEIVEELGLKWVVMGSRRIIMDGNCNMEALSRIENGTPFLVIEGKVDFPGEDGVRQTPIGLVMHENEIIYRSPGFDLEAYNKNPFLIGGFTSPEEAGRALQQVDEC